MALPSTLVWEVRPTNGTANAGGGFDPSVASPGTDFSQQNAVQIAFTDLVIGGTTTQLTSAANPFGSTHVGNNIAITSGTGFTAGIYNIRSVAGVTATMDRAVGTASSTGGNGNLGGARNGFSTGTTTLNVVIVASNLVWVKNEAWNELVNLTNAGAFNNLTRIIGYNTSRGDNPTGSNRPNNNRAAAATNCFTCGSNYVLWQNLIAQGAGSANMGFRVTASQQVFVNCRATGNAGRGFSGEQNATFIACEADGNSTDGMLLTNQAFGCNAHGNTSSGFNCNQNAVVLNFCIAYANSGVGFLQLGNLSTMNACTSNANTGASTDGMSATYQCVSAVGNIFSNNGRYGANGAAAAGQGYADYNDFFNNATAARNLWPTGPNDQTLDPQFTNAAAGNFAIGTNLKALGWPGAFPGGNSTGFLDIGAVQRQEAGGGSSMLVHPGMVGGLRG